MVLVRPIALVDVDCFYAAAEIGRRPELERRPVAIGGPGNHSVIATANYVAREFGVKAALAVGVARKLCPDLVVLAPDFDFYHELSVEVMAVIARWCDVVEPMSPDEAYLSFDESVTFENALDRAEDIRAEVKTATGLDVSVGVSVSRASAKMACSKAKPNGAMVVGPNEIVTFMAAQPLAKIPGLGPASLRKLEEANCRTIEALGEMAPATLARLVGEAQAHYLRAAAKGLDSAEVVPRAGRVSISTSETLEEPTRGREDFHRNVTRIARTTILRMWDNGVGAKGVSLSARGNSFKSVTKSMSLGHVTNDPGEILGALRAMEEAVLERIGGAARQIGVGVTGLSGEIQLSLDLGGAKYKVPAPNPLPMVGARVAHRVFGEGKVVTVSPDSAVIRFSDAKVRVIGEPREHLTVTG